MSASVNKVILVGNVGKDPELRSTQGGARIASLTLATSEIWKDRDSGERKERTEWHRVSILNDRLVEVVEKYIIKGTKLFIEGAIQSRKYTDRDGNERHVTEIVLSRFRGELTILDGGRREEQQPERSYASRRDPPPRQATGASAPDDFNSDIPF